MNAHLKTLVIWLVVIAILVIGYQIFNTAGTPSRELDESEFYALVEADEPGQATTCMLVVLAAGVIVLVAVILVRRRGRSIEVQPLDET